MERKFKAKLKHSDLEALKSVIEYIILNIKTPSIEEKLILASLGEVLMLTRRKIIEYKKEYKINFSAVQAIAVSIMNKLYVQGNGGMVTSFQAAMILLCNEIDQQYNLV